MFLLCYDNTSTLCSSVEVEAGFTPGVTSKISEGPESIISLVIDDLKWAFEDVKFLIRKGHDLNKYDQNSLSFNRHRRSPFFVAMESHINDIAKFLLLNGAQPLQTSTELEIVSFLYSSLVLLSIELADSH
jgi:hypothetical protein